MIKKTKLDCKYPVGNGTGVPTFQDGTTLIPDTKPSMANPGELNQTASQENLSAKFKYPRVSQDVPEAGRNQYM